MSKHPNEEQIDNLVEAMRLLDVALAYLADEPFEGWIGDVRALKRHLERTGALYNPYRAARELTKALAAARSGLKDGSIKFDTDTILVKYQDMLPF